MEPAPGSTPVRRGLNPAGAASQRMAAMEAIRAVEQVHGAGELGRRDEKGELQPLPIVESDGPLVGEYSYDRRTGNPTRIDLSRAGAPADRWPALVAAHEIGHYLDHVDLSSGTKDYDNWESAAQRTPEVRAVMQAIRKSKTYSLLPDDDLHWRYPWELWSRAYAQYIAWRSGSSRLKSELDKVLTHDAPSVQVRYWPYDEFAPIAAAIDELMEARGWATRKDT